jgi:peptidoglycan hydrolase-like protein with peptidoglycan-binding domain
MTHPWRLRGASFPREADPKYWKEKSDKAINSQTAWAIKYYDDIARAHAVKGEDGQAYIFLTLMELAKMGPRSTGELVDNIVDITPVGGLLNRGRAIGIRLAADFGSRVLELTRNSKLYSRGFPRGAWRRTSERLLREAQAAHEVVVEGAGKSRAVLRGSGGTFFPGIDSIFHSLARRGVVPSVRIEEGRIILNFDDAATLLDNVSDVIELRGRSIRSSTANDSNPNPSGRETKHKHELDYSPLPTARLEAYPPYRVQSKVGHKAWKSSTGAKILKIWMHGHEVRNLQIELNKFGANLDVDGKFGPKTDAAVKQFQLSKGLKVDGKVGPHTFGALIGPKVSIGTKGSGGIQKHFPGLAVGHRKVGATTRPSTRISESMIKKHFPGLAVGHRKVRVRTRSQTRVHQSAVGDLVPGLADVNRKVKLGTWRSSTGAKVIQIGMKGSGVAGLQNSLNKFGANLDVDGKFGPKTDAAVKQFQLSKGLKVDGIVGPKTWKALRR